MKQISYIALGLLTLLTSQIRSELGETREIVEKQNALVKEIEQVCIWFFKSENRKALDDFRFDEAAMIKSIDGTPEEVEAAFKAMYLTHALAHTEIITLHYMLENIESQLIETGLSLAEVYLVSIDAMDKIFTDRRDPEKLQQMQENITKQDPSLCEQEKQYALRLLYQLKDKQYESEGQRLIMAMQARNMLERTYIRKKYAVK